MTRDNVQINVSVSQETYQKYDGIIGFDLGSSSLNCSYLDKNDPDNERIIIKWGKNGTNYPTKILYQNQFSSQDTIVRVGFEIDRKYTRSSSNNDKFIKNIKDYVFKSIRTDKEAPVAETVLSDLFTNVYSNLKLFRLRVKEESQTIVDKPKRNPINIEKCRFVFAVPDGSDNSEQYIQLVYYAFKRAGFLKQGDKDDRLIFVNDSIAAGYTCLVAPKSISTLERISNHFLCDIGYNSIKIAKINAQSTDEMSEITCLNVNLPGYSDLDERFKKCLQGNDNVFCLDILDKVSFEAIIKLFSDYEKGQIEFSEEYDESATFKNIDIRNADLRDYVFQPYVDSIFKVIFAECNKNNISKVFFRGKFSTAPYFLERGKELLYRHDFDLLPSLLQWPENPMYMVSHGATTFGLRAELSQIPTLCDSGVTTDLTNLRIGQNKERDSVYKLKIDANEENHPKGSFVVGIDFGTTFSGCSYACITGHKKGESRNIKEMKHWNKASLYEKSSTVLRYNEITGEYTGWGDEALQTDPQKNELHLKDFKLLLSPKNVDSFYGKDNAYIKELIQTYFMIELSESEKELIETPTVSAKKSLKVVDIIAQYLMYINKKIKNNILNENKGILKSKLTLNYVITVPAMWDKIARNTMVQAAIKAKLITSKKGGTLQLISEPEAAALACDEYMKKQFESQYNKEDFNFIVCDAGGGTVDLVAFRKTKKLDEQGKMINTIEQIGEGVGDTCGAVNLDKNFRDYIVHYYKDVMGLEFIDKQFLDAHINYFRKKIKDDFYPDRKKVYDFGLPAFSKPSPLFKPKENAENHWDVKRNRFKISSEVIKKVVFDPVIQKVLDLIDTQIGKCKEVKLSSFLLVGGFSRSKYLEMRIKKHFDGKVHLGIPPNRITAVSEGAVSYYLIPRLVTKKIVNESYAIQVNKPGETVDQLAFFIQKGSFVDKEEKEHKQYVAIKYPNSAIIAIFSKDQGTKSANNAPRLEEISAANANTVKKLIEFRYSIPKDLQIEKGAQVRLAVSLQIEREGVRVKIKIKAEEKKSLFENNDDKQPLGYVEKTIKTSPIEYKYTASPEYMACEMPLYSLTGLNRLSILFSKRNK